MSLYLDEGGLNRTIVPAARRALMKKLADRTAAQARKVLLIPPDYTRFHSGAGELSALLYAELAPRGVQVDVLPALGTHSPMSAGQIASMFPGIPPERFLVHDWRNGIVKLGELPGALLQGLSEGRVNYAVSIEVNRRLVEGGYDHIFSLGQVVPHEVIGMANENKNILVGVGGKDIINRSHFLGAVYGMERIMGRPESPVREAFNSAQQQFLRHLPLTFVLTVLSRNAKGGLDLNGLFAGSGDHQAFRKAAFLSQQLNIELLDKPLKKVVVWLDPSEFKSTWLGNKAVYRTRMAIADHGELLVLAPGIQEFGEDPEIDRLVRSYGYRGTPATLAAVEKNEDLRANLSAAAHLIHGSSEGRFRISVAAGKLSRAEIEGVGFEWADLAELLKRYDPAKLKNGVNTLSGGEEIFFISNPALGLWGLKSQFGR